MAQVLLGKGEIVYVPGTTRRDHAFAVCMNSDKQHCKFYVFEGGKKWVIHGSSFEGYRGVAAVSSVAPNEGDARIVDLGFVRSLGKEPQIIHFALAAVVDALRCS